MNRAPASKPDINMTPLIDVLLVLLIIFMVISPVKPHEFETKVPERSVDDGTIPPPWTLVISIAPRTLALSLNDTPVSPDGLARLLAEELARRDKDKRAVFVKGPRTAPYREVVRVVDLVKGAGADPVGLQVDYLED